VTLTRHFLNFAILVHVAAINGLEIKVTSDLSVEQDFDELAAGHDELGDEIDIPVSRMAKVGSGLGSTEFLEQILERKRGGIRTIIIVAVHVKHSLS
jgi:hypothetical protein